MTEPEPVDLDVEVDEMPTEPTDVPPDVVEANPPADGEDA